MTDSLSNITLAILLPVEPIMAKDLHDRMKRNRIHQLSHNLPNSGVFLTVIVRVGIIGIRLDGKDENRWDVYWKMRIESIE